jgi:hypothetical protein
MNRSAVGRGKAHVCQFAYRGGGNNVYVCSHYRTGVTPEHYAHILATNPKAKNWDWRPMLRDATVHVRGRVWHPDHKTVVLNGWHRVLMNTENLAPGARNVVFLD